MGATQDHQANSSQSDQTSKKKFEKPILEKQGSIAEVTAGFFGSFSP